MAPFFLWKIKVSKGNFKSIERMAEPEVRGLSLALSLGKMV